MKLNKITGGVYYIDAAVNMGLIVNEGGEALLVDTGVRVDQAIAPGVLTAGGCTVEIADLAGHSLGQVGVSSGGVLFCADAVIAPEVVEKHGIPLNTNLWGAMKSFEALEKRNELALCRPMGLPSAIYGLL